jgi:hypothetical protein
VFGTLYTDSLTPNLKDGIGSAASAAGGGLRAAVEAISKRLLVEDLGDGFSRRRPQPEQAVLAP